ncbi:MAG: tRNA uridine-5-carboxymethylaminomethyl(34) synthesis GTPase MnmE [Roseovarius sp.]|nr:tRNA uridine-5-carboxymethylaminomethyl(34) synthesis GTPase MnmE [Roseovarius sp.]
MDTIFALSTPPGKSGVAIVRVSGENSLTVVRELCGDVPPFRQASLRIVSTTDGDRIDEALVLTFDKDKSFTGEYSAEFHVHGSPAVVAALMGSLSRFEGCRPAVEGEFTRRALENGRLDLSQVEGLADLLESETEAQRQQALRVLSGDLRTKADAWRAKVVRAAALIEATIDFADEDVPVDVSPEVLELVEDVRSGLKSEIDGVGIAERVRSGFEVAIVGPPNAGKSTLLNYLAGRDAAITSEIAGTTRDVIEVRMDLDGLPVTLLDTAGLRNTDDPVESIGVGRTRDRARQADLRVFLLPDGAVPDLPPEADDIVLHAKADLRDDPGNGISGQTGYGVAGLVTSVTSKLKERTSDIGLATRYRHRDAMERGLAYLESAIPLIHQGEEAAEIAADEMRAAIRSLESLVGRVDVENLLDEIFASFCLGK